MKYTSEQLEQINQAIPIVEYASKYLDLQQKKGSDEYWTHCCFHPNDSNASLSFNSEKNLFNCFACGTSGGLINFVMEYHKKTFMEAIDHILSIVDIPFEDREYSNVLEYLRKKNRKRPEKETVNRIYLDDNIMNQYAKEPIKEWLDEGIKQEILDKYNVRYDKVTDSIVFPIYDINGKIITVKARTLNCLYQELDIPKYKYYNKIITNDFLFGLYENIEYIKEKNEVIVFEGCKGVMLAEGYGYKNCVSLETNNINEYQIDILLQLKCDVVMALDKGIKVTNKKMKNNEYFTYVSIGLLPSLTNVYVIEDNQNLLPPKASPVDVGKNIFDGLYERRCKL